MLGVKPYVALCCFHFTTSNTQQQSLLKTKARISFFFHVSFHVAALAYGVNYKKVLGVNDERAVMDEREKLWSWQLHPTNNKNREADIRCQLLLAKRARQCQNKEVITEDSRGAWLRPVAERSWLYIVFVFFKNKKEEPDHLHLCRARIRPERSLKTPNIC